jgi:hypothetical protein
MIFEQLDLEILQGSCKLKLVVTCCLIWQQVLQAIPLYGELSGMRAEPCLSLIL